MAAFGSATLPALREPVLPDTPFSPATRSTYSFGSAVIGSGGEAPPEPSERPPGDYLTRFASKQLATARELLYTTPARTTAVIRHVGLINDSGSQITATLWLGGLAIEPGLAVPAGESRAQDGTWILLAGEKIEGQASGAGLNALIYGVEEVR